MPIPLFITEIFKALIAKEAVEQAKKTGAGGLTGALVGETEKPSIKKGIDTKGGQLEKKPLVPDIRNSLFPSAEASRLNQTQPLTSFDRGDVVATPQQQYSIPPEILRMAQARTQPEGQTLIPPGFFAGLRESTLGMPSTRGQIPQKRTGRQTAYYGGKTIGDIIRSGMKLDTSGELQRAQQIIDQANKPTIHSKVYKNVNEIPGNLRGLPLKSIVPTENGFKATYGKGIESSLERIEKELGIEQGYTPAQENMIRDNMNYFPDKTREEIIEALTEKGLM